MCNNVRCHNSMARPQVAYGGNSLQLWRIAANRLNKQPTTVDKGWFYRMGFVRGAKTLTAKNKPVTKSFNAPWTRKDYLDKRNNRRNMDMRFCTWNIKSLYRPGSLGTVSKELAK
jgi:hypothetical protein